MHQLQNIQFKFLFKYNLISVHYFLMFYLPFLFINFSSQVTQPKRSRAKNEPTATNTKTPKLG